uniref:Fucosyltransferase n=1 Tax=Plectus sambesii TaxID=2011161 RepID=A0A914WZF1_9BILA
MFRIQIEALVLLSQLSVNEPVEAPICCLDDRRKPRSAPRFIDCRLGDDYFRSVFRSHFLVIDAPPRCPRCCSLAHFCVVSKRLTFVRRCLSQTNVTTTVNGDQQMSLKRTRQFLLALTSVIVVSLVLIIVSMTSAPERFSSYMSSNKFNLTALPATSSSKEHIVWPPPKLAWENPPDVQVFKDILVLQWSPIYGNGNYQPEVPAWCKFTNDKSRINEAHAVVVHTAGSDLQVETFPFSRPLNQTWIMFSLEPPSYWPVERAYGALNRIGINRTMTYRFDSDYPSPYAFAVPGSEPKVDMSKKTKLVAWMVSNCNSKSGREQLSSELQKYVKVDVYGGCGQLSCPKDDTQEENCYKKLATQYKFYLSFENSLCRGYMTEKFSNPLKHGMVPVVFGGGNYSDLLPHSKIFINAKAYPSMKELAEYLLYLDKNATAYEEYFEWRTHYSLNIRVGYDGFRRMCNALQAQDYKNSKAYDVKKWWLDDVHCGQPFLGA